MAYNDNNQIATTPPSIADREANTIFGQNKFFNQEQKNIFDKLEEILNALQGTGTGTQPVGAPVNVTLTEGLTVAVNVEFQVLSIDNSANDSTLEVSILSASGVGNLIIQPGDVYNFQVIPGRFYDIQEVANNGTIAAYLTGFRSE